MKRINFSRFRYIGLFLLLLSSELIFVYLFDLPREFESRADYLIYLLLPLIFTFYYYILVRISSKP